MVRFGRPGLLGIGWLVIGLIVAAQKDYFESLGAVDQVVSALLAILLWPLLFLGADLHLDF